MTTSIIDQFQSLQYELLLPASYNEEIKDWPFIVFLHGSNRRGHDISMLDRYGLNGLAKEWGDFPFVLLTPQCPADTSWIDHKTNVVDLIQQISQTHRIDSSRIYLTGFSLGGNGTWEIAAERPELFAAIAPIAGWMNSERITLLKDMPVWNFHGDADNIVPITRSEDIINMLMKINDNVRFTRYKDANHGIMDETYRNKDLYEWFLRHSRN